MFFDFFRVKALAILFHEMIASPTAHFRLLVTCSAAVSILLPSTGEWPVLLVAYTNFIRIIHSHTCYTRRVPWLAVSPPFNYVKTCLTLTDILSVPICVARMSHSRSF